MKKIPLFNQKYTKELPFEAIVDDDDYDGLSKFRWYYCIDNSGTRKPDQKVKPHVTVKRQGFIPGSTNLITMHRQILGLTDPSIRVKHKNGDPLDCRKENLKIIMDGNQLMVYAYDFLSATANQVLIQYHERIKHLRGGDT